MSSRSRVSRRSLKEARRHLNGLADVCLEEEGDVPAWVVAAREAVTDKLQERDEILEP